MLVFLGCAGQQIGVSGRGPAVRDFGDDVAAGQPVGFGEVGGRPVCGVIGVGVVEAGDFKAATVGFAYDAHQFSRRDLVAAAGGAGACIHGGEGGGDPPSAGAGPPEQGAAAFLGIAFFPVGAEGVVDGARKQETAHGKLRQPVPVCEIENSGERGCSLSADWKASGMKRTSRHPGFDETMNALRSNGFDVAPSSAAPGGMLVSKFGAGAVLVPVEGAAAYAVRPGLLVRGEVARLVDRGYQKFIKSSQYELPATAPQLQAIHTFNEELTQLAGGISLYNESLGTTSDRYLYDRLQGREAERPREARPWELAGGH